VPPYPNGQAMGATSDPLLARDGALPDGRAHMEARRRPREHTGGPLGQYSQLISSYCIKDNTGIFSRMPARSSWYPMAAVPRDKGAAPCRDGRYVAPVGWEACHIPPVTARSGHVV